MQHALEPQPRKIIAAEGAFLIDEDGRSILDAISSWWVITHGHRHPRIVEAIREAAGTLDQIIFAEFTHEAAESLATELIRIAPKGLEHVFFSDSGSIAVEVALKMALGYFQHSNTPRSRIVVMEHGYHGDTIGAMSAGERGVFNATYAPLLFSVERIPFPESGAEQATLDAFERLCGAGDVAALLVEPLVLGAGGMRMYAPHVLKQLKCIAESHGVIFIADEVMTGWGRTGTLFACEQADIAPDILCASKGLTGGSLPLAVTLCSARIFDAHLSTDRRRTFFHSSSYTANAIACAAAVANLRVWEDEPVRERIAMLERMQRERLRPFISDSRFSNVRQHGTIVALDLNVAEPGYLAEVGPKLREFFRGRNILLRPLGNVIYVMPPYCVTPHDLDRVFSAIDEAADAVAMLAS
jgi:adenosylmethionine-8-amino-7-oxononanoate aminotransferase